MFLRFEKNQNKLKFGKEIALFGKKSLSYFKSTPSKSIAKNKNQ